MIWKVLLNVLLNIGIIVLVFCIIWAFNHKEYPILAGALFSLGLLIMLKWKMIKTIRELTKKK